MLGPPIVCLLGIAFQKIRIDQQEILPDDASVTDGRMEHEKVAQEIGTASTSGSKNENRIQIIYRLFSATFLNNIFFVSIHLDADLGATTGLAMFCRRGIKKAGACFLYRRLSFIAIVNHAVRVMERFKRN